MLILLPARGRRRDARKLEELVGAALGHRPGDRPQRAHRRRVREEARRDVTVQTTCWKRAWSPATASSVARFAQAHRRRAGSATPSSQAKLLEQQQRHASYDDTAYSLEPNFKESPGGLRDLQIILWIARAGGLGASVERRWPRRGIITREEARQSAAPRASSRNCACACTILAGRREDRLLFDFQTALAAAMRLARPPARAAPAKQLMQRYYRTAKAVTQLNTIVLQNLDARVMPAATMRTHADQRALRRAQRAARSAATSAVRARARAHAARSSCCCSSIRELKGMTAPTLRALWHARVTHRRRVPARPGQPRALPGDPAQPDGRHARRCGA